jgi:lysozyme family protein
MATFDDAVAEVLKDEGGKLIPDDHGRGPSKWGVTLKTAQQFFPHWRDSDIANLTKEQATEFYRMGFWEYYHYDRIDNAELASKVFNEAVNLGGPTVNKILQNCVGVTPDGTIGPGTLGAVNANDASEVLACLKAGCEARHKWVAEHYPELASNLSGWLARDMA